MAETEYVNHAEKIAREVELNYEWVFLWRGGTVAEIRVVLSHALLAMV